MNGSNGDKQSTRILRRPIGRRTILKAGAAGLAFGAFPAIITRRAFASDPPTLVNALRAIGNPYEATWNKGGAAFAKAVGSPYVTLVSEGNSEKGIADVKAILAKTGGNCVININPNDSPDTRVIVQAVKAAGGFIVTQWNKPDDLHPWDYNPNYVAHILYGGFPYGKAMGETLIKSMGGKGGIVGLRPSSARPGSCKRSRRIRGSRSSTFRWRTGLQPKRCRRPTPGSPSSATKSVPFGRQTTKWPSLPLRPCEATDAPARFRSPEPTAFSSLSKQF